MGKVSKQAKLVVLSHSVPLLREKIGKVVKQAKLAILSHSVPLQCEKIGKMGEIGQSESFCTTSVGKDWKSCKTGEMGGIDHS